MRSRSPLRVLIVAYQTADSPQLLEAVARRADQDRCLFTLLVLASPRGLHRVVDPEDHGRVEALRRARPRDAAGVGGRGEASFSIVRRRDVAAVVRPVG